MRIAWIGPMPGLISGASGVSNHILKELDLAGIEVDCFVPGCPESIPKDLQMLQHVRFVCEGSAWQWGRWYSRNRLMSFVTGQAANLRAENRLAIQLLIEHERKQYDIVYQFSHIELSVLRRFRKRLPPIIVHPSVHAQGELRWHRAETHLSASSEPFVMRAGARLMLLSRVMVQKRHIRYADLIIGLSRNFADELIRDYEVPPEKLRLVPNPIDLKYFTPPYVKAHGERLVILYVSRIAVRKGVEMVVELSHRLDDLRERVEIQIVGGKSQWSDYTGLLKDLNPRTAKYIGEVGQKDGGMRLVYQRSDMLIQPSHYEPFGLTVGEALASEIPVVVSDMVGAGENVDQLPCRQFPHNDIDAFETEVRNLIRDLEDEHRAAEIRLAARRECERLFDGKIVVSGLLESFSACLNMKSEKWQSEKP